MKHCHFSILYNELGFLQQKLPFLYEHFDQIIFYDLSAFDGKYQFSTDGSHEYIKNYPDPENKITLIELRNGIEFVQAQGKPSNITKMRMFPYASGFVNHDMDTFWCTDMDEFFTEALINEVEYIFTKFDVNSIQNRHYLFWNDPYTITCEHPDKPLYRLGLTRIARHKPGNVYGHCNIGDVYKPCVAASQPIYHFTNVGKEKTFKKLFEYFDGTRKGYKEIWEKYSKLELEPGEFVGYPYMHPNPDIRMGIMKFPGDIEEILDYVDFNNLIL